MWPPNTHFAFRIRNVIKVAAPIVLVILFFSSLPTLSWFIGDNNEKQIIETYIRSVDSKLAEKVRNPQEYLGIDLGQNPFMNPIILEQVVPKDKKNLVMGNMVTKTMTEGIMNDLPWRVSGSISLYQKIENKLTESMEIKSTADSWGKVKTRIGDNVELHIEDLNTEDYLLFIVTKDPAIARMKYEDLRNEDIQLIPESIGTTKIQALILTREGSRIIEKELVVKKAKKTKASK